MKRLLAAVVLILTIIVWRASGAYFHSEDLYTAQWSYWKNLCHPTSGSPNHTTDSYGGYGGLRSTSNGTLDGCYTSDDHGLMSLEQSTVETKLSIRQGSTLGGSFGVYVNPFYDAGFLVSYAYKVTLTCGQSYSVIQVATTQNSVFWGQTSCHDNMTLRVIAYNGHVLTYIDTGLIVDIPDAAIGLTGTMGFQVLSSAGTGNLLTHVDLGGPDTTPPATVTGLTGSASYNYVSLQWSATTDSDSGVSYYKLRRNGNVIGTTQSLTFTDSGVVPNSTYTYTVSAFDFFGNESAQSSPITKNTLHVPTNGTFPSALPEGRRVGVRTTGAYWGAGGENIDVMSGNLNFTVPLIKPTARGGMSATFSLSYNSQNWKQDSGAQWKYGGDVGYGFGWRLIAGSITPIFSGDTIIYYFFIDSSGSEYRLDQNSGNVWTSKESVYVSFDANLNRLYFNSGTFWDFGCVSAASEADGGVMYPTLMEDTNGNVIFITYNSSPGASWTNSSARISYVEDVRAILTGSYPFQYYKTYNFTYTNLNGNDPFPHLTAIDTVSGLTTGETYSFTYQVNQSVCSPFNGQSCGNSALLQRATSTATNTYNQFTSNGSGEVTNIRMPYGGYFAYSYTNATYSNGRSFREVQNRYLSKDGSTQTTYPFSHEPSPGDIHQYTILTDPSGNGQKYWSFATSGASMGLLNQYQGRQMPGQVPLVQNDFTWVQDGTSNSYIGTALTTADPGQSYAVQKKSEQTVDTYGNVTQAKQYAFGNLATAARTSNYTYLTDSAYLNRYIRNRLYQASLTDTSGTTTLAGLGYDQSTLAAITGPTPREWDTNYTTSVTVRGNVTTLVTPAATSTVQYDVTGNPTSTTVNGITSTSTTDSSVNYAAPTQITTGSFADALGYDYAFHLTSDTGPAGILSITYDAGRVSTISKYGANTSNTYNPTGTPPTMTTTANGVSATVTLDGLGRPIKSTNADGVVDTEYDSCGCSPTGKMKRTSLPHSAGTSPSLWTTYSYDGIGRTTSVVGPDNVSTTSYLYLGNTVRVTDPAGKWKKFTMDASGQLVQVNEPNPGTGTGNQLYSANWADFNYGQSTLSGASFSSLSTWRIDTRIHNIAPIPSGQTQDNQYSTVISDSNVWAKVAIAVTPDASLVWAYNATNATFCWAGLSGATDIFVRYQYVSPNLSLQVWNATTLQPLATSSCGTVSGSMDLTGTAYVGGLFNVRNKGSMAFWRFYSTANSTPPADPGPGGELVRYEFESAGNLGADSSGNNRNLTLVGSPTQISTPNSGGSVGGGGGADYITTYGYDSLGHVNSVNMQRSTGTQTRSFTWSGAYLQSATNPENGTVNYTYNQNGKIFTRTDAKGQRVIYSYDQYARLTSIARVVQIGPPQVTDVCGTETYSYDTNPYDASYTQNGNGRLTAIKYRGGATGYYGPTGDPNSPCATDFIEMYSYNSLGGSVSKKRLRVTRYSSGNTHTVDLEQTANFNSDARMTDTQYPPASKTSTGGTGAAGPYLGYTYDAMGRAATMTNLANSVSIVSSTTFNAAGEMLSISGQYSETRTYNSYFQLSGIVAPGVNMTYNYSATQNNGKITSQYDGLTGETVQYQYDALNRLASAVATSNSWGQSYTYDGFGNLTDQNVIAGSAPSMHVNYNASTNRQTGDCSDANGNISPCVIGTYTYDVENRLTAGGSGAWQYSYAPGNKRLYRKTSAGEEITFWGITGQKVAAYSMTFTGSPAVLTLTQTGTWWYLGGKLIKNAPGYVGQDRIGSVGNKFYPYGQEKSATPENAEKFATYTRDGESGLDYADQRFHSPGQGRFLTPDPYRASAGPEDSGSWNRYAYTRGDPVNRSDPTGLTDEEQDDCDKHPQDIGCIPLGNGPKPGRGGETQRPAECQGESYDFVANNIAAAAMLANESQIPMDFLLAWSAWESGWGKPGPGSAVKNGNFFGLTTTGIFNPDPGTGTGGWVGAVACKSVNPNWSRGYACFNTGIMSNGFYESGHAALVSQGGLYGGAIKFVLQEGGSYGDALQAVAQLGYNSESDDYGYMIMGGVGNDGVTKYNGSLGGIQKILKSCFAGINPIYPLIKN